MKNVAKLPWTHRMPTKPRSTQSMTARILRYIQLCSTQSMTVRILRYIQLCTKVMLII